MSPSLADIHVLVKKKKKDLSNNVQRQKFPGLAYRWMGMWPSMLSMELIKTNND